MTKRIQIRNDLNHLTSKTFSRILLIVLTIFISLPLSVRAATTPAAGNGFIITPVKTPLDIPKGTSSTFEITVTNPSDVEVTAHPVVNDFIPSDDESGSPRLILDANTIPPRRDFKSLVSPLEDFVIPPKQKKIIDITISVPVNAEAGGYYGAIRFTPILPSAEGRNVALTASIASIVLVTVPGDLSQQLDIVQLSAGQNSSARGFIIGGDAPIQVITRLKNSGNIHVQPFGKVQVKNMFGKIVYEYEFNNTNPRSNVLPDSIRKFVDEIPNSKKFMGRYTITLNLSYTDGGGEIISAKTTFWYLTTALFYGILGLILAIILVVNFFIVRLRKKRNKHHTH